MPDTHGTWPANAPAAEPHPINGLYGACDFYDAAMTLTTKAASAVFDGLAGTDHPTVAAGQLTGHRHSGHGKPEFIDALMVNLAQRPTGVACSFENSPEEHPRSWLRSISAPVLRWPTRRMTQ